MAAQWNIYLRELVTGKWYTGIKNGNLNFHPNIRNAIPVGNWNDADALLETYPQSTPIEAFWIAMPLPQ